MMTNKIKTLLTISLLLNLTACNMSGIKEESEETTKTDYFELKEKTDQAYMNDDLVTSEKGYEILIQDVPTEAENWFRLGNIYVRTNRPVAAINLYREAVLRDPKYSKAWYNLSIVQLKQTAYSLNEMLLYTDINDPLHTKAKEMLVGIEAIIKQD
jgi:tetratricopeptide (TPR) repeat protein